MQEIDIIPHEERCEFCRNSATNICDYPVGHWVSPHMVAEVGKLITCDRRICNDCATNLGYETDFCPDCMEKVRKLKQGNHRASKS